MSEGPDILSAALTEALDRRLCVSAWVGHPSVLFLGLGTGVIAERHADGTRPRPPFELQTNFAEWSVQSPQGPVITDADRAEAEIAARALIGRPVMSWQLAEDHTLRVQFYGGAILTVAPMSEASSPDKAAWWVCLPGGRV